MECGAKISVFPMDEITTKYLDEYPRINNNKGGDEAGKIVVHPGSFAKYVDEYEIECNKIEPQVSGPDNVDKVHTVGEMANVEINKASYWLIYKWTDRRYGDSCTYAKGTKSS